MGTELASKPSQNTHTWQCRGLIAGDALPAKPIQFLEVIISPIPADNEKFIKGPSIKYNLPEFRGPFYPKFSIIPSEKNIISQHAIYCEVTLHGDKADNMAHARKAAELKFEEAISAMSIAMPEKTRYRYKATRFLIDTKDQSGTVGEIAAFYIYKNETISENDFNSIQIVAKANEDVIFKEACNHLGHGHKLEDENFSFDSMRNLTDAYLHYFRGIELASNKLTEEWRVNTKKEIECLQIQITNELQTQLEKLSDSKRITAIQKSSKELDKIAEKYISMKLERALKELGIISDKISVKEICEIRHTLTHGGKVNMELKEFKQKVAAIEQLTRKVLHSYANKRTAS